MPTKRQRSWALTILSTAVAMEWLIVADMTRQLRDVVPAIICVVIAISVGIYQAAIRSKLASEEADPL